MLFNKLKKNAPKFHKNNVTNNFFFFLCLPKSFFKKRVELQPDLSQGTASQYCLHTVYRKTHDKPLLPKH